MTKTSYLLKSAFNGTKYCCSVSINYNYHNRSFSARSICSFFPPFFLSFLPSLLPSSLFLECYTFMPFCFVVNTVCRNNILKWRHILKMNIYIYNNCDFAIATLFVIASFSINFIFNYLKNNNLFLQHQESKFAFTHELTFFIFISIRASTSLTPG